MGRVIKVRVPASIANLGPGFDVLAMAVDLWLEAEAEPAPAPDWRFEGELPPSSNPISELAMRGVVRSAIRVGVGLGSSAAARIAALAMSGVDGAALLQRAAAAEGHPDNAAAAVEGGVVAVVDGRVHRLPAPDLEVALFVSAHAQPTEHARALLPDRVSRADAVHNAARLALLVHALHRHDWTLLGQAMDDRLHQPYRAPLYPWTADVMRAANAAGAYGSAIAGAGPSVFAFCAPGTAGDVARVMAAAAASEGSTVVTRVVASGLSIER
jgi:homoserine kinase